MRKNPLIALIVAVALFAGCDSAEDSAGDLSVRFRVADASQALAKTSADGTLEIAGTNGTLRLTGVHVIVAEFELERLNDDDCDLIADQEDDDGCEKFEAPPFFVDLPLDETAVTVASSTITPDTYKQLDFEVERLDDDDLSQAVVTALLAQIRNDFPDWPIRASLAFVGEFETSSGEVRPFKVYADSEIEIEMDFDPPITIDANGVDQDITIVVDPSEWLVEPNGAVMDLSAYDYDTTSDLLDFEVEIENGFKEIEFDD